MSLSSSFTKEMKKEAEEEKRREREKKNKKKRTLDAHWLLFQTLDLEQFDHYGDYPINLHKWNENP